MHQCRRKAGLREILAWHDHKLIAFLCFYALILWVGRLQRRGEPDARQASQNCQIPSDLVVKSQVTDIIDLLLQLIRHPNGVHRSCHHRKSSGVVLSTSAVQWATTKFDGVWKVWLRQCLIFHYTIFRSCLQKAPVRQSCHAPRGPHAPCTLGPWGR